MIGLIGAVITGIVKFDEFGDKHLWPDESKLATREQVERLQRDLTEARAETRAALTAANRANAQLDIVIAFMEKEDGP